MKVIDAGEAIGEEIKIQGGSPNINIHHAAGGGSFAALDEGSIGEHEPAGQGRAVERGGQCKLGSVQGRAADMSADGEVREDIAREEVDVAHPQPFAFSDERSRFKDIEQPHQFSAGLLPAGIGVRLSDEADDAWTELDDEIEAVELNQRLMDKGGFPPPEFIGQVTQGKVPFVRIFPPDEAVKQPREDVPRFLSDEADFQDGFQNRAGGDAVRERVRDDKGKCGVHGLCYCLQQDTKRPAGAVQSAVPHETEQISISKFQFPR